MSFNRSPNLKYLVQVAIRRHFLTQKCDNTTLMATHFWVTGYSLFFIGFFFAPFAAAGVLGIRLSPAYKEHTTCVGLKSYLPVRFKKHSRVLSYPASFTSVITTSCKIGCHLLTGTVFQMKQWTAFTAEYNQQQRRTKLAVLSFPDLICWNFEALAVTIFEVWPSLFFVVNISFFCWELLF